MFSLTRDPHRTRSVTRDSLGGAASLILKANPGQADLDKRDGLKQGSG